MTKRTGPENPELINLIYELKQLSYKQKVNIWKRIAEELERPTRKRRIVNLEKINRVCKDNESIIVPGKVLASGELDKKIIIAAFQFSEQALNKINEKGKALTIQELIKQNPKGSKLRIIG